MARKAYSDDARVRDYLIVFEGTDEGKRVLADILSKANVFSPILDTDPMSAARKEGARALALHIASLVAFDKKDWTESVRNTRELLTTEIKEAT